MFGCYEQRSGSPVFAKLWTRVYGSARGKLDRVVCHGCNVFGLCRVTKGCFAAKNPYLKKQFLGEPKDLY